MNELASLISDRTKLIIINSPQNPTGGVLSKQDIHDIADAIGDRNILVLSDEIYSRLIFEGEYYSIMSVPGFKDRTALRNAKQEHRFPLSGKLILSAYNNPVLACV